MRLIGRGCREPEAGRITVTDITERKQAEAKLRESYAIPQAIMEYLPEGLT